MIPLELPGELDAGLLLAVSGGGDSMAMMHLVAARALPRVVVATLDHGLRAESGRETLLVAEEAQKLGLSCVVQRLNLEDGADLQRRARDARRQALEAIADERGLRFIALAHTLDDQAETVLDRLLRGAGLRGIAAMQTRRERWVRPLLGARRLELRAYLDERALPYVNDPSNRSQRFRRVRLRDTLAALAHEDAQVHRHLAELASDAFDAEQALDAQLDALGLRSAGATMLGRAPVALRRRALRDRFEAETGRRLRRAHLEDLEALCASGQGEVLIGGGWRIRVVDDALVAERGFGGRSA